LFQHSFEISPNNVRGRNLYSNQLLKAGRTQEALRVYEGTLALAPDVWETNFALGYTLATAGRLDESEMFLRKSVQLDPRETVGYVVLAEVLRARGKRDSAVSVLESGMDVAYNRVPLQEKMKELQGTVSVGR
jgi:Flp pilus assembly protein TadD